MAPVTPPRATVTLSSTYKVGGPSTTIPGTLLPARQPYLNMAHRISMPPSVIEDLCMRMGNLEYKNEALVKKIGTMSDAEVADNIAVGEIWPRVTTVERHVQVMASQEVQDVIIGLSQQVQTLQTSLHGAELQNQQLRTRLAEMKSRESTLMSYMLWMEERLALKIGLGVLTRPVADELPTVYQTLGENYNERVLPSIIQETLKVVVAYKAQMEDLRSQFHGRNNMRKAKGHNGNNSNRPYHKHGLIALICGSMQYDIMTPKGEEEIQRYVLENGITNVNVHQIDQKENHLGTLRAITSNWPRINSIN
ncbi:reverse transcriptase domain-containing protein, partial [Tanacetum coccineum]